MPTAKKASHRKDERRTEPLTTSTLPPVDGKFRSALGSSIVEEFVAGHTPSDVLRELVQNEYDGKGTNLTVTLGTDGVHVSGNGEIIEEDGWRRLEVLLGTGRVVGSVVNQVIQPKVNGLGSKNFGLRSLFLFGNRIYVRSGGEMAVLDLPELGSQRVADPASIGRRGVTIFVPYRAKQFQSLEPFTVEREKAALDGMSEDLLHTMVKLVAPGSGRKLTAVTVESLRTGRILKWRQNASPVHCHVKNVRGFRRLARLTDTESSRPKVFEELEFQKAVEIPDEYKDKNFADYFGATNERLRIGISVPLKRRRILSSRLGRFYYPLAISTGFTGSALSVSAPFDVDADRTSLIESDWNSWLIKEASKLTIELLCREWLPRFGADAYIALRPQITATPQWFVKQIAETLRTAPCWPTKSRNDGQVVFRELGHINIVELRSLEQFLDDDEKLDSRLSSRKEARDFARQCGSPAFTLNSLVRLRCGPSGARLATQVGDHERNYHYTNYETSLKGADLQSRMAAVLTEYSSRLSAANRKDLRETPSTLAADNSLQPATSLLRIPLSIWDVCPVPLNQRIHPDLLPHKAVARYASPFAIDEWIRDAAERCRDGTASDEERRAAFDYLLNNGATLNKRTLSAVRQSPLVRDHRDEWIAPALLISRKAAHFKELEPVLSAPGRELERSGELSRRLRIREKLSGADLVKCATFVSKHPELAERFEHVLNGVPKLLTPKTVNQLLSIRFLQSTRGELAAPSSVHQKTPINLTCLESEDRFVTGTNVGLYRRLGCPDRPTSAALLEALSRWQISVRAPAGLARFYIALVAALRREHLATNGHSTEPILWINNAYYCPDDTLVGREFPRCFLSAAVSQVRGPDALCGAFAALGAHTQPTSAHWIRLVEWFGEQYKSGAAVRAADRAALLSMYRLRAERGLPEGTPEKAACLLDDQGAVFSISDLRTGSYVENDYPELAAALRKAHADVGFAVVGEQTALFFTALGLQRLSEMASGRDIRTGPERPAPTWLRGELESREVARLQQPSFISALSAIGVSFQRRNGGPTLLAQYELRSRMAAIRRISFVESIVQACRLSSTTVDVPLEIAVIDGGFSVVPVRSRPEFDQLLARAIAELLGARAIADIRTLQTLVLPLLQCSRDRDIIAYLRRQGIEWQHSTAEDDVPEVESRDANDHEIEVLTQDVLRQLADDLSAGQTNGRTACKKRAEPVRHLPDHKRIMELPPFNKVRATIVDAASSWTAPAPKNRRDGRYGGYDIPHAPEDVVQDDLVGDRGEEIVYRRELQRVRRLGYSPAEQYVIWTSRNDPLADHDIQSVSADGGPLWIEVKSTTGTDGRFYWSKKEFERALRERERYELWRVYRAHTRRPTAKCFRDPVSLLNRNGLRLELGTLRAVVEPMKSD